MHLITLWVEGYPAPFVLRFKGWGDREAALLEGIRGAPAGNSLDLVDDYGKEVTVPRSRVWVIEHVPLEADADAQVDLQIMQRKAQMRGEHRVAGDKGLQLLQTTLRPGMISPNSERIGPLS